MGHVKPHPAKSIARECRIRPHRKLLRSSFKNLRVIADCPPSVIITYQSDWYGRIIPRQIGKVKRVSENFPINLLCLFPVPQRCTSFCTIGTISPQSAGLRTIKNQKRDNHHVIANRALVSRAMAFIPLIVSLFSGTLSEQEATRLSGAKMAADVVLGLGLHPFFLPDRSAGVLRRVAMCMARQTTQASFRKSRRITKPGA